MIGVKTIAPGIKEASLINAQLERIGIHDVRLFFDKDILPRGMWAVVQIAKKTTNLLLPESYDQTDLQPYILWWVKDDTGHYRNPDDTDLMKIVTVVKRAPTIWNKGEKRADKFDALDAEKDRKHREKFKQKIHDIAPAMKKAIREGNM